MSDYSVDTVPAFDNSLKGNSAEGNILEKPMQGYGKYSAPERPGHDNTNDALGAFIQGGNPANTMPAGKELSGNKSFNPME